MALGLEKRGKCFCMKRLILLFVLTAGAGLVSRSQVSINVNIGVQPVWGPVGYDYVEYYYMPDIEVYYDVPHGRYVYWDQGRWLFSAQLPARCRNYDIYNGYKVVINEPRAYLHFSDHRSRYGRYRGYYGRQVIIRNRPHHGYEGYRHYDDDDRYERRGRGRGHGHGHKKGKGKWRD